MTDIKIALFVGHNLVAQTFKRLLQASALSPAAIFRPTFAKPSQSDIQPRDKALALTVGGATTASIKPLTLDDSTDTDSPVEIHAGALDESVEQQLQRLDPELIISVCYPRKLPAKLLNIASLGGLNLHPSPLPAWRGNDPVFWQLRAGCTDIGLSWHRMTDVFDDGVVVARSHIALSDAMSAQNLDREIAQRGVTLLADLLGGDETALCRHRALSAVARGRYFSSPTAQDYRIFTSWTCDHARRFVGLLQSRGIRFHVHTATTHFTIRRLFDELKDDQRECVEVDMIDGSVAFLR